MSEASIASSASCSSPMFYSFLYRLCVSPAVCSSFPWPSSFLIVSLLLYSVLCIVILRYIAVKKSNNKGLNIVVLCASISQAIKLIIWCMVIYSYFHTRKCVREYVSISQVACCHMKLPRPQTHYIKDFKV